MERVDSRVESNLFRMDLILNEGLAETSRSKNTVKFDKQYFSPKKDVDKLIFLFNLCSRDFNLSLNIAFEKSG